MKNSTSFKYNNYFGEREMWKKKGFLQDADTAAQLH